MISLSIGNIDLKNYITKIRFEISPYEITPESSESGSGSGSSASADSRDYFLNYDGRKIYASYSAEEPSGDDDDGDDDTGGDEPEQETVRAYKTIIRCSLEGLPDRIASNLTSVLQTEYFNASYTSPNFNSGNFICTSYSAEPDEGSHEDGSSPDWNIDLVIETQEETLPDGSSGSGSGDDPGADPGEGL